MKNTVLIFAASMASAFGFDWDTKEIEGVKYAPLDQLGQFYSLPSVDVANSKISFKGKSLITQFEVGSRLAVFNKVHFELIHAVREDDGRNWLSVRDLKECVDPVLRPAKIAQRVLFKKVILDPVIDLKEPKLVSFLKDVKEEVEKPGFEVEILWQDGQAMTAEERLAKVNQSEAAIYLEFQVDLAKTASLKTSAFGAASEARGQSVAVATALHWAILNQQGKSDAEMSDRWIALSGEAPLAGLSMPACRLDLSLSESSATTSGKEIAVSIAKSLNFARKVMDRQPKKKEEE